MRETPVSLISFSIIRIWIIHKIENYVTVTKIDEIFGENAQQEKRIRIKKYEGKNSASRWTLHSRMECGL